jgi:hypothetical protein
MSVLLTTPTISPLADTRTLVEFFSFIGWLASSTVLLASRMITSELEIDPTVDERYDAIVLDCFLF